MKRLLIAILVVVLVIVGGAFVWEFAYDDYVKQAQEEEVKARLLNK